MFKKALIALGLLGATTFASGCVVVAPRPYHEVVYGQAPAVVVAPAPVVVPVFGFYGGYYRGWGGYYRR
jgi:hypothetical protein